MIIKVLHIIVNFELKKFPVLFIEFKIHRECYNKFPNVNEQSNSKNRNALCTSCTKICLVFVTFFSHAL